MNTLNGSINEYYFREGLLEEIIRRLESQGVQRDSVQRSHIAAVDEFNVRGAAVSKELAKCVDLNGRRVLDVGCGLGGPCRMLADEVKCEVTGIDLNPEFIRTARALSQLVNLSSTATFIQGDATNLPFRDATFDVVLTQRVQMNIPDKKRFYSEIDSVLRPGGYFLYYEILKNGKEQVSYPMPWASREELSFLFTAIAMDDLLSSFAVEKQQSKDQTVKGIFKCVLKLDQIAVPLR